MKRVFPVVIDESVRGDEKYKELANYWEKKKDEKELVIKQVLTKENTVLVPIEKKVILIEEFIHQLQKLAEITEDLNSYSFKSLEESSYTPLITKINERLYGEKKYK